MATLFSDFGSLTWYFQTFSKTKIFLKSKKKKLKVRFQESRIKGNNKYGDDNDKKVTVVSSF